MKKHFISSLLDIGCCSFLSRLIFLSCHLSENGIQPRFISNAQSVLYKSYRLANLDKINKQNVTAAEELIRQRSRLLSRDCVSRPFLAVN